MNNTLRTTNRDALRDLIVQSFAKQSKDEVIALLEEAGIANASVNDMQGVWDHPQLKARERWENINSPVGELPALLPPGRNNRYEYRMDAVPGLGQHTDAILHELKLSDAQIEKLKSNGVV